MVSRLPVAIPTVAEQQSIVRRAEGSTTGLTVGVERAHRELDLLREYRTRLIADVVTGKLDVREAAARLPEGRGQDDGDEPGNALSAEASVDEELVDAEAKLDEEEA